MIDLRLGDDWGIDVIAALRSLIPGAVLALVSACAGPDAAVAAMRAGAQHVSPKPITCASILDEVEGRAEVAVSRDLPSLASVEWEHLARGVAESRGNISEAARRLGLSRSGLQRRLRKTRPPR